MLDVVKFCQAKGIAYLEEGHHHCASGWIQIACPFCAGGIDGWHLGFALESGAFNCWRCGKIDFWRVMGALCHTNDRVALGRIVGQYQSKDTIKYAKPANRPKECDPPYGAKAMTRPHRAYLRHRGGGGYVPGALETLWGLKGTGSLAQSGWGWRVVYPIHNPAGHVVAWQGRAIGPANPQRYKTTANADCVEPPDTFLYGIERAVGVAVVIVEGSPGVWRMGPGCVATLGQGWHAPQADRLRHFKRRYLIYDPEPAAQKRAAGLAEVLSLYQGVTEIVTGFKTDPGDFSQGHARKIMRRLSVGA